MNNGILIYKTSCYLLGNYCSINVQRNTLNPNYYGPTLLATDGTSAEYTDYFQFVKFQVSESNVNHPYNAKIKISACDKCELIKGIILVTSSPILSSVLPWNPPELSTTYSDLDLHAYTLDGRHVGMNYTSGEYEIQIPGAVSSGDQIGGEEWIFVLKGTEVKYHVDSHDVQEYLKEHPEIDPANATMNYSTEFVEYGENPQLTQLPDGNWIITDRTVSIPKESTIGPGSTNEVLAYIFSGFLQPINADGGSIFKLGSTVSVKFQLKYPNNSFATNAIVKIFTTKIDSGILGTEVEAVSTSTATAGNLFRYDAASNQYVFNLGTKSLTRGTYQIRIELDDGTSKYVIIGLK